MFATGRRSIRKIMLLLAILAMGSSFVVAEEVEVRVEQAEIKVWDEVVAKVSHGDRFEVLERREGWIAVAVETDQGVRRGWISSNHVKTLMDPEAAAPAIPRVVAPGINVTVDSIQLGFDRRDGQLVLRVTIENKGAEKLPYHVDDLKLVLGTDEYEHDNPQARSASNYSDRILIRLDSSGSLQYLYAHSADWLSSGELNSGESAAGWVRFKLPDDRRETEFSVVPCRLIGSVNDRSFTIDLRSSSLSSLAATPQTSVLEPSIPVWEVYGPINALNIDAIRGLKEQKASEARADTIIVARSEDFFIDSWSLEKFGASMNAPPKRNKVAAIFVPPEPKQRQYGNPAYAGAPPQATSQHTMSMRINGLQIVPSVDVAAIRILSFREDSTFTLLPLLEHTDPVIRRSVVGALIRHRDSKDVYEAILEATNDADATVRVAALRTLAGLPLSGWSRSAPRHGPREQHEPLRDEKTIAAMIAAFKDDDAKVRSGAARAARQIADPKLVDPLIETLDDPELSVVSSVASSLVAMKSEKVIQALRRLRTADDMERRAVAIRSLKDAGELSGVEAAIAQLEEGKPSHSDFTELERFPQEDAIEPLVEYLQQPGGSSHYIDIAARILGKLQAKPAVDALLEQLRFGQTYSQEIPRALGRIGDPKAIEPLWKASRASNISSSRRVAIYEALIDLGSEKATNVVTEAIEQKDTRRFPLRDALKALARDESEAVTTTIAAFLDDTSSLHPAAQALALQGTPAAVAALKARLLDAKFTRGSYLLSALQSEKSPHSFLLLRAASKSANSSTQQLAQSRLNSLNSMLRNARKKRDEGDLETAIRYLQNTVERTPGFLAGSVLLANLYRDVGRESAAAIQFQQAAKIAQRFDADDMTAADWGYAGHAAYRAERYEFAAKALQKAIDLRQEAEPTVESGPRWWFLAMSLHRLGQTQKANEIFQQLSRQVSDDSPAAIKDYEAEATDLMTNDR